MPDSVNLLSVKINSPDKIIWEGKAEYISSVNSQGPFDILPSHANFITIVENKPIKIKSQTDILTYTFTRAVIYNHSNNILIYTNL